MTSPDHPLQGFQLPFSHSVNVRTLPRKGRHVSYEALPEICEKIAAAYGLISVEKFFAQCVVQPWKKDGVKLSGSVICELNQPSAVSGDPLQQSVDEEFQVIFLPENSRLSRPQLNGDGELVVSLDGDDVPETFSGDSIDLASVWLEFFALGLNPFARLEHEEFDAEAFRDPASSPFAALAALKKPPN